MVKAEDIIKKYSRKIESEISSPLTGEQSKDYTQFKEDMIQEISSYERWAKSLGSFIKINPSKKDEAKIQKYLEEAHIDVTPAQSTTLAAISFISVFLLTILISISIYLITSAVTLSPALTAFFFLGILASIFIFYYTYSMPQRLANSWKLKASSQMVPAILYVVVYMKHTSNLERAVEFAAQHLEGPLALDFKKIFYDVETAKFSTIKQSLDNYLERWLEYAPEFAEAFHLIESSLYEPSENRRIQILEKALQVILDGIYEKMLKYSRAIRSPLTNVYMLGIILPTLGLAIVPLASTLLQGAIKWYHLFILFNIIIPFLVFFMTSEILLKRPGGYGDSSILELNPDYYKYKSRKPWAKAAIIAIPFLILGFLPFIFQIHPLTNALGLQSDWTFEQLGFSFSPDTKLFDFRTINESTSVSSKSFIKSHTVGPFGPLGVLLSLFIPFSIGLFFLTSYKLKTRELIKSRENTKELEEEFTNSLFQLGNRLGDGVPAEIAFSRVAQSTQGQKTNQFFVIINQNIQNLGMSAESAIFDKKRGAIIYFPSALIATSMRILIESAKKGLQVAARSLMSISEYLKNIQKINQRLQDLLAEIVSDMKSNMTFLAPLLAGIVVGLSAMIIAVLNKLQIMQQLQAIGTDSAGIGALGNIAKLFGSTETIPPFFLQISIGVYIIQIIFILTIALVTVDSGKDPLKEKYEIYKNLKIGLSLYLITALISILALSILATIAIPF